MLPSARVVTATAYAIAGPGTSGAFPDGTRAVPLHLARPIIQPKPRATCPRRSTTVNVIRTDAFVGDPIGPAPLTVIPPRPSSCVTSKFDPDCDRAPAATGRAAIVATAATTTSQR